MEIRGQFDPEGLGRVRLDWLGFNQSLCNSVRVHQAMTTGGALAL